MIDIERVPEKIRRLYRRQAPFDVGEHPVRPRLGEVQERRASTKLRPHSEHLISVKGAGDAVNVPAHDPRR